MREIATRIFTMPANANGAGDIFGGWLVAQMDLAGAMIAVKKARGRVVTVAINDVLFHQPVFVGDLLCLYVDVVKLGNSSITVDVEVEAERAGGQIESVTSARLVYVAIDENRKPLPVFGKVKGSETKT
jgi:acyl-CoA thioesterase YciA